VVLPTVCVELWAGNHHESTERLKSFGTRRPLLQQGPAALQQQVWAQHATSKQLTNQFDISKRLLLATNMFFLIKRRGIST
jgi:hypothetical protein